MQENPVQRLASAVTVTAVLVLAPVGLAGSASAQTFSSCGQAAAAGVYNIPESSPAYSADLDSDGDGIACEKPGAGSSGSGSTDESVSSSGPGRPDQVTVVPEGGAETGDGSTETSPAWWLGGGLLAAAAALVGVRRARVRA